MAIFSDAAGFKYMGDCQWGTLNIGYPSQSYLEAHPHSSVSAELTSLCSSAGLPFRNVMSQSNFDALSTDSCLLWFGSSGGIDDRYLFYARGWGTAVGSGAGSGVYFYNDSGSTQSVNGSPSATNKLYHLAHEINGSSSGGDSWKFNMVLPSSTVNSIQWVGGSDGNYLALCFSQRNFGTNSSIINFLYAGLLADVNSNFSYYNANNSTRSIGFTLASGYSSGVIGSHYIANAGKLLLQSGDAAYAIACSDGQTPNSQWATDFYAFDNNSTLGFPAIGRVRGMLLGIGSYTLGKPVKIIGSVFPDGGSPWYIPVGTYAGKTLLMRCYSTMT